jgi:hypothetical protein
MKCLLRMVLKACTTFSLWIDMFQIQEIYKRRHNINTSHYIINVFKIRQYVYRVRYAESSSSPRTGLLYISVNF